MPREIPTATSQERYKQLGQLVKCPETRNAAQALIQKIEQEISLAHMTHAVEQLTNQFIEQPTGTPSRDTNAELDNLRLFVRWVESQLDARREITPKLISDAQGNFISRGPLYNIPNSLITAFNEGLKTGVTLAQEASNQQIPVGTVVN